MYQVSVAGATTPTATVIGNNAWGALAAAFRAATAGPPPAADLTIVKSHSGSFTQGQTGAYTIRVSNVGGPTTSTVNVSDILPSGLTATSIGGSGWTCTVTPLACSRGDVLGGGGSYQDITVTVNVASVSKS